MKKNNINKAVTISVSAIVIAPLLAWYIQSMGIFLAKQRLNGIIEAQKLYSKIERTQRAYIYNRTKAYTHQLDAIGVYFDNSENLIEYIHVNQK